MAENKKNMADNKIESKILGELLEMEFFIPVVSEGIGELDSR